jgi:hypothetical protein
MWQLPQGPVGPSGRFISPHRLNLDDLLTTPVNHLHAGSVHAIHDKAGQQEEMLNFSLSDSNGNNIKSNDVTEISRQELRPLLDIHTIKTPCFKFSTQTHKCTPIGVITKIKLVCQYLESPRDGSMANAQRPS